MNKEHDKLPTVKIGGQGVLQAQRQLGLLLFNIFEEIKKVHDDSSALARKIARANMIFREMTGLDPSELKGTREPPDFEC